MESAQEKVDVFIRERVDSVPHLEALLLLFQTRPKVWSATDLGNRLYLTGEAAQKLLTDLVADRLIAQDDKGAGQYYYLSQPGVEGMDELLAAVEKVYRRETIRISTMIHAKASPALRDFARAFKFRKGPS